MVRLKIKWQSKHDELLPMEVIEIILFGLPVTSLLRFKCVSKAWLSTISSPHFSKTLLLLANSNRGCCRVLLSFAGKFLDHLSLSRLISTPRIDPGPQINLPMDYNYNHSPYAILVGSCRGLICVVFDQKYQLLIWNPSTRKRRSIPTFGVPPKHSKCIFGFGFHNADYKVIVFFTAILSPYAKVYSFRTGRWKKIIGHGSAVTMHYKKQPTTFGNGKFYWVTKQRGENNLFKGSLCYLELETQVYKMFEIPEWRLYTIFYYTTTISEHKNCVYVLRTSDQRTGADVFVCKEDSNNENFWTKWCVIDYAKIDPWVGGTYKCYCTFHVLDNGEIILLDKSTFMMYNPKDGSMKFSEIRSSVGVITYCIYFESLAWL